MTKLRMTPELESALLGWVRSRHISERGDLAYEEVRQYRDTLLNAISAATVKLPFHEALQEKLGEGWTVTQKDFGFNRDWFLVSLTGEESGWWVNPVLDPAKVAAVMLLLAGEGE